MVCGIVLTRVVSCLSRYHFNFCWIPPRFHLVLALERCPLLDWSHCLPLKATESHSVPGQKWPLHGQENQKKHAKDRSRSSTFDDFQSDGSLGMSWRHGEWASDWSYHDVAPVNCCPKLWVSMAFSGCSLLFFETMAWRKGKFETTPLYSLLREAKGQTHHTLSAVLSTAVPGIPSITPPRKTSIERCLVANFTTLTSEENHGKNLWASFSFKSSNNVIQTINHPPVITIFIGSINHSQSWGFYRSFHHRKFTLPWWFPLNFPYFLHLRWSN